jgi:hypothetical protein
MRLDNLERTSKVYTPMNTPAGRMGNIKTCIGKYTFRATGITAYLNKPGIQTG